MLHLGNLRKSYGSNEVLRGLDLDVDAGQIMGLVGSNGAGKSTLISIACGLIAADAGDVFVGEGPGRVDVSRHRARAAGLIGLAPQDLGVYPMLSVKANLTALGELSGLRGKVLKAAVGDVAERMGLADHLGQRADTLSGGQARRLHTGMALLHRPPLLFLDEPTVGADVTARRAILDAVQDMAREGTAVVYTTHYLTELEDLEADIAVLHQGQIVAQAPVGQLIEDHAHTEVSLTTTGARPDLPGWEGSAQSDGALRWNASPLGSATAALADALARIGTDTVVEDIDVRRASLESAFVAITGRTFTPETDPNAATEGTNNVALTH
jgi:ABC-2 type transport system ATP-binding protein